MTHDELRYLLGEEKLHSIVFAVTETFGEEALRGLFPLQSGKAGTHLLTLPWNDERFLVRVVKNVTLLNDPSRQFASMTRAAQHGIAPEVLFANADSGVAITRHIEEQPIRHSESREHSLLASTLKRLHAIGGFPSFVSVFDVIEALVKSIDTAAMHIPASIREYLRYISPLAALLHTSDHTSCNNDLNPRNLIFDGNRYWIWDWELASMADPLFDVATVLNYFIFGHAREAQFLSHYFDRELTIEDQSKLFLWRQISFAYYALTFINGALHSGTALLTESELRALLPYRRAVRTIESGLMRLSQPSDMMRFGLIMMKESFEHCISPRYERACALLGSRQLGAHTHRLDAPTRALEGPHPGE